MNRDDNIALVLACIGFFGLMVIAGIIGTILSGDSTLFPGGR